MQIDKSQIKIRSGLISDTDSIVNLMFQLGYPISYDDMRQIITTYLTNDDYYIFVVTADEKPIGTVSMITNNYFHQVGKFAILSSLVIDQKYRANGIGNLLLDYVETYAKQNHCISIELKSGIRRIKDGTHNFYKKRGYLDNAAHQTYFKKNLSE